MYVPISMVYRIALGAMMAANLEDMYSTLFFMFIAGIFLNVQHHQLTLQVSAAQLQGQFHPSDPADYPFRCQLLSQHESQLSSVTKIPYPCSCSGSYRLFDYLSCLILIGHYL
jgi:hypothetical protein